MAEPEGFIPYQLPDLEDTTLISRAQNLFEQLNGRRSVREFSDRPVPQNVIADLIRIASTAPSGANKQPWTFSAVSDPKMKKKIREAAEQEEYRNYHGRMSQDWLDDLQPFGTSWQKPFLEIAPWLIVAFRRSYEKDADGNKLNNYYVQESVGLAVGFLLAAVHQVGLAALTHTPSPLNFLTHVLERPANERPFLLIPVGWPAAHAQVPDISRKPLDQVAVWYTEKE